MRFVPTSLAGGFQRETATAVTKGGSLDRGGGCQPAEATGLGSPVHLVRTAARPALADPVERVAVDGPDRVGLLLREPLVRGRTGHLDEVREVPHEDALELFLVVVTG